MKKSSSNKSLKIVSKAIDKYAMCTIYGFVYDSRKINMEKINAKQCCNQKNIRS